VKWLHVSYNLYCVGGDVKPCSINQSINESHCTDPVTSLYKTHLGFCWKHAIFSISEVGYFAVCLHHDKTSKCPEIVLFDWNML